MKNHSCIICGKTSNGGIIINGALICRNCETRLVNSDFDTDFYIYYKERIKKTIVQSVTKGADFCWKTYH